MLQVARLAPNLLHDAATNVVGFLHDQQNEDGGARDRAGQSDLYYTAFLLDALIAMREELPALRVQTYLRGFGDGDDLDLVHRACLVRCWTALDQGWPSERFLERALANVEAHRSADGGYGPEIGARNGTLYSAFLALGAYQDLGRALPEPGKLVRCVEELRSQDGGYADAPGLTLGTTPTTAAAATLLTQLGATVPEGVGEFLLAQAHPKGGFLALPGAPIPDLLSTATALHALATLEVSFEAVREAALDFIDTLWTGRGFCGHWDDDEVDCEYAFYALLALGQLSL